VSNSEPIGKCLRRIDCDVTYDVSHVTWLWRHTRDVSLQSRHIRKLGPGSTIRVQYPLRTLS